MSNLEHFKINIEERTDNYLCYKPISLTIWGYPHISGALPGEREKFYNSFNSLAEFFGGGYIRRSFKRLFDEITKNYYIYYINKKNIKSIWNIPIVEINNGGHKRINGTI